MVDMQVLIILNDPPYGTERSYNGLRLAGALAKRENGAVRVFLSATASAVRSPTRRFPTATTTSTA
jgi:uncharacterized protein involved in oxidation of intracellular sulfur